MDKERAQLATSARCSTEIVEAAFAHGRRRPHVESEDDYCFGAGTVDALKGGGAFFSFASGPRRYLKQPNLRLFDVALRALAAPRVQSSHPQRKIESRQLCEQAVQRS
jgi:hypothetical protein